MRAESTVRPSVEWPVEVVALVVSPGHNYWFHSRDPSDGVGPHPTLYPEQVDLEADAGIVGDRFFGKVSRLASAVSFVAAEAVDAVGAALDRPAWPAVGGLDPRLLRRNLVVRGVDLNALRHQRFSLDSGLGPVEFEAAGETSPCAWMDAMVAAGARDLLRGRGGLRANPTTSGSLRIGPAVLRAAVALDPARAGDRMRPGRLP